MSEARQRARRLQQLAPDRDVQQVAADLIDLITAQTPGELLAVRLLFTQVYGLPRMALLGLLGRDDRISALDNLLDAMSVPREVEATKGGA